MQHEDLSNDMGLFLQKVNITRDYLVGTGAGCRGTAGRDWVLWGKGIHSEGSGGRDCAPMTAPPFRRCCVGGCMRPMLA